VLTTRSPRQQGAGYGGQQSGLDQDGMTSGAGFGQETSRDRMCVGSRSFKLTLQVGRPAVRPE